jgi:uncharacterized membrane protein
MANKKETKKVVKKERVSKAKLEPINENKETKKTRNRLLTYKQTAILYFICAVCWFISAVLNYISGTSVSFDILIGVAFLVIGILYAANIKKDR